MTPEEIQQEEKEAEKDCPCCGGSGPISSRFGFRKQGKDQKAKLVPQSHCKKCRSGNGKEAEGQ
ncbi:MAG: hypothetical protein K2Y22_04390 [Candidatus Obscuribacterales bacterium]|nr:hypothetical protein [Candidatus Obscuribacterales bacterium]